MRYLFLKSVQFSSQFSSYLHFYNITILSTAKYNLYKVIQEALDEVSTSVLFAICDPICENLT